MAKLSRPGALQGKRRQACEQAGVPVFGAIPRDSGLEIPSRHLGLVTAVEHGRRAHEAVAVMTELVARHVDIEAVARCAGIGALAPAWDPQLEPVANVTVALAAGKAFSFGYAEHRELLVAAGADVLRRAQASPEEVLQYAWETVCYVIWGKASAKGGQKVVDAAPEELKEMYRQVFINIKKERIQRK